LSDSSSSVEESEVEESMVKPPSLHIRIRGRGDDGPPPAGPRLPTPVMPNEASVLNGSKSFLPMPFLRPKTPSSVVLKVLSRSSQMLTITEGREDSPTLLPSANSDTSFTAWGTSGTPQRPLPRVRGAGRGQHHRRGDDLRSFQEDPRWPWYGTKIRVAFFIFLHFRAGASTIVITMI